MISLSSVRAIDMPYPRELHVMCSNVVRKSQSVINIYILNVFLFICAAYLLSQLEESDPSRYRYCEYEKKERAENFDDKVNLRG